MAPSVKACLTRTVGAELRIKVSMTKLAVFSWISSALDFEIEKCKLCTAVNYSPVRGLSEQTNELLDTCYDPADHDDVFSK